MSDIRRQFENDGYVVIEDFLTLDEVSDLKKECQNLVDNMPEESNRATFSTANSNTQQDKDEYFLNSADKVRYFFEADAVGPNGELKVDKNVALFRIGHALHALNPVFKKISFDERVKESCFQLGFADPVIVQSMLLFKNPGVGSEVAIHQDACYLHTEPIKLLGFWIALEDATPENGCLWFAKGSHKSGVHRRYVRNPDKDSDSLVIYDAPQPHYQKNSFTPVAVKKGTCVLIHGQVVHYSEANKSDKSRLAYTFHIVEQKNTKWSEDNWIQMPEGKSFLQVYKN